ncbi:hypothetical protein AB0H43_28665 [Hamadaea sp. NPDC050747]|uniref:hypothetical protein n=1 Tax=Hamadaea sp. NPDC050747 TaxID=3155789 RepID=UPI0033E04E71
MVFLVELDVDEYGMLFGGTDALPLDSVEHDWNMPYPQVGAELTFEWEEGDAGRVPNVFSHGELLDWVCDDRSLLLLEQIGKADLRDYATGTFRSNRLTAVQVTTVLEDLVDREKSIIDKFPTYEIMRFPAFRRAAADRLRNRIFRIPEMYPDVFLGEDVRIAIEAAGITGLRFAAVDWA